ncbi:MFS transporter [bacterium LRH843]|nr:MFS transporter [bacterium LRH843]
MNKLLVKMAILSVSLLTIMAGAAISPALGDIALAFPDSSETMIKLILTLPSVMIIPFIYVSSYLTRQFPKKHILLVGMFFYFIGGLGGGLVSSIELLLVCRAILGIGVGLLMPISTSLVADFFYGEERTATMGQVSAANNLGGVVLFIMSGILAGISWRVAFGVYALVLVSAVIVLLYLPKTMPEKSQPGKAKARLPKKIYMFGAAMFFILLAFYSIPANIALFMQQEGIGNSHHAGIVIAIGTAAGFVAGLILARLTRLLQSYYVMTQLVLMAVGFFVVSFSEHTVMLGLGVGLLGFGMGALMPTVFDQVTRHVPRSQTVQAMAVVTSMLFFGQFFSPIILDGIGVLFGNGTIRFTYQFLGCGMLLVAIGFFRAAIQQKRAKEQLAS